MELMSVSTFLLGALLVAIVFAALRLTSPRVGPRPSTPEPGGADPGPPQFFKRYQPPSS
jgi:hypothetical protein